MQVFIFVSPLPTAFSIPHLVYCDALKFSSVTYEYLSESPQYKYVFASLYDFNVCSENTITPLQ